MQTQYDVFAELPVFCWLMTYRSKGWGGCKKVRDDSCPLGRRWAVKMSVPLFWVGPWYLALIAKISRWNILWNNIFWQTVTDRCPRIYSLNSSKEMLQAHMKFWATSSHLQTQLQLHIWQVIWKCVILNILTHFFQNFIYSSQSMCPNFSLQNCTQYK